MSIKVLSAPENKKLVFLMHGLGARKDYPHMQVMGEEFFRAGFNVINIDACDSNNASEKSEDGITFSGHFADLVDVIEWAKTQKFYVQPFCLAGQSMGAVACAFYAELFPSDVQKLVTANLSWLDGSFESEHNRRREEILSHGEYWQVSKSTGKAFVIKKNYLDDLRKYNLCEKAGKITADTTLIVGMADSDYHIQNNEKFFGLLSCQKQIVRLDGVPHDLANTPETESAFRKCLREVLKEK